MPGYYDDHDEFERYVNCMDCEREIDRISDAYRTDECGCCYHCYECAYGPRRTGTGGTVHPYSYKPRRYNSKGNYPTEVLMGIELEVGGQRQEIANRVAEVDADESTLYCKQDCSIYGTEIVSHPMTLNWCKEWGGYDRVLDKLREDECWTDKDHCMCGDGSYCDHEYGLHIHVSRNAFRQLRKRRTLPETPPENETYEQRIGRELREMRRKQRDQEAINHQMIWLMFIERNADQLNGDTKLARRDSGHYGAFKKSNLDELRAKAMDCGYYNESRYTAINCQNDKTYELRFFKSTVDTEEFYAALEFADASVEYTRGINANDVLRGRALEWSNFVGWLHGQTDALGVVKYPNLIAQISALRLDQLALV